MNYHKSAQQRRLNTQTKKLLGADIGSISNKEAEKIIDHLKEVIAYHDYRYYLLNDPVISDPEYDKLFTLLRYIETKWPDLRTPDSPTQRIPGDISGEFPKVKHLTPMLSLDNSYRREDLAEFDRRIREHLGKQSVSYSVEPKFDGTGISLIYENDIFVRGATRGNGIEGEDITCNLKLLRSIPLKAAFSSVGIYKAEIRGEVLLPKSALQEINNRRLKEGKHLFANPRNAAAGSIRLQDPAQLGSRKLEAFVYQISYAVSKNKKDILKQSLFSHEKAIDLLHRLGFRTPYADLKTFRLMEEAGDYCLEMEKDRDNRAYEIDGAVIKLNDIAASEKLGYTSHHPRWAIAFKFKPRQATTVLREVAFHVGKSGTVTPVAKLDPVAISGVVIRSATLHNEAFIRQGDLHYGDTVLVERAGDVIPYIVKPVEEARPPGARRIIFPTRCPSCRSTLHKEKNEAAWRCLNINCPGQVLEKLIHFCRTMEIEGLGASTLTRFYREGIINSIPDVFNLPFHKIKKLEGFGEKSVRNLQQAIAHAKENPPDRFIAALSIRYVGWNTAAILAGAVKDIQELYNCKKETLIRIKGIGSKVAEAVCHFFSAPENIRSIETLRKAGVKMTGKKGRASVRQRLTGVKFVFTGKLKSYTREKAAEVVKALGGEVSDAVSPGVTYLVAGEAPGSKLEKARKNNTKIIQESEFKKLVLKK